MGVKGLATYLKTYRHKLSYVLELPSKEQEIAVVVDGWSLLYAIYNLSGEPWVYGGEYASLGMHMKRIISVWRRVGIRVTVVFDGPSSPLKFPTLVTRLQNNCVKPASLFFRTSAVARVTPRSLAETRIPPPLGYSAILSTLLSMVDEVDVKFAEGEADCYIVELAGKLGAYVMANDSDFVVLNSEGYKGYIPLDELVWCATVMEAETLTSESLSIADADDAEFQVVTKKKKSKFKPLLTDSLFEVGKGPIPPSSDESSTLSLVVTVYEPSTLAENLSLPSSLLPLFGSLVGNDYASIEFFRSSESLVERIQRVASTLSSVLKDAQSTDAKKVRKIARGSQGGVMDVIGTTIERLFLGRDLRNPPTSGQIEETTEIIVQSTLEYAVHNSASLFAEGDIGPSSRLRDHELLKKIRSSYIESYHKGTMHPLLIQVYIRGHCFPRHFLEDPDRESCVRSIGRPIREYIWKLFAYGGGIPNDSAPDSKRPDETVEQTYSGEEDENEIIGVIEEFSDDEASFEDDPLAVLRGRLQRLSFSADGSDTKDPPSPTVPTSVPSSPSISSEDLSTEPRLVTEYVRRGTRISNETCEVTVGNLFWEPGNNLPPPQLWELSDRLTMFLRILGSDTPLIQKITHSRLNGETPHFGTGQLLSVLALRWVLQTLHRRADGVDGENNRRDRQKEKWTMSECHAYLYSISHTKEICESPPPEDRAIQMTAQILAASEAIEWLAQALLLVEPPQAQLDGVSMSPFTLGENVNIFSGRRFHAAISRRQNLETSSILKLSEMTMEGLQGMLREEPGPKRKQNRKTGKMAKEQLRIPEGAGRFAALAQLGIE